MHLLIDVQGLQNDSRFRGIGRYTKALILNLIQTKSADDQITLLINGSFDVGAQEICEQLVANLDQVSIFVWHPITPCDWARPQNLTRRLISESIREFAISTLSPDAVLISSLVEGCGDNVITSITDAARPPTAAIFYDLIPFLFPTEYLTNSTLRNWYSEKLTHFESADLLLSISEAAKNDAMEHLPIQQRQIVTISSGFDPGIFDTPSEKKTDSPNKYGIHTPYLLYVGAGDPRKNLNQMLCAFATLSPESRGETSIVLVGQLSKAEIKALKTTARKNKLPRHKLIITGHIEDEDMVALYKNALAFVFPSLHEGFGLPLLEAIAAGIPVVASDRSAFPEVLGTPEGLFDPTDLESIAYLLDEVINDEKFRQKLIDRQSSRLAMFPWDSVAKKTWENLRMLNNTKRNQKEARQKKTNTYKSLVKLVAEKLIETNTSVDGFVEAATTIERNLDTLSQGSIDAQKYIKTSN